MARMDWPGSILSLTRTLVAIPSRAGVDSYDEIARAVADWLTGHGVEPTRLRDDEGRIVGLTARVVGGSGPTYLLAATLDTAPFGSESSWTTSPLTPDVRGGWWWG